MLAASDPATVRPATPPERVGDGAFLTHQAPAGKLFIQGTVRRGAQTGLFDDVVGAGFVLVGAHADPSAALDAAQRERLAQIGARVVWFASEDESTDGPLIDVGGVYPVRGWASESEVLGPPLVASGLPDGDLSHPGFDGDRVCWS